MSFTGHRKPTASWNSHTSSSPSPIMPVLAKGSCLFPGFIVHKDEANSRTTIPPRTRACPAPFLIPQRSNHLRRSLRKETQKNLLSSLLFFLQSHLPGGTWFPFFFSLLIQLNSPQERKINDCFKERLNSVANLSIVLVRTSPGGAVSMKWQQYLLYSEKDARLQHIVTLCPLWKISPWNTNPRLLQHIILCL